MPVGIAACSLWFMLVWSLQLQHKRCQRFDQNRGRWCEDLFEKKCSQPFSTLAAFASLSACVVWQVCQCYVRPTNSQCGSSGGHLRTLAHRTLIAAHEERD